MTPPSVERHNDAHHRRQTDNQMLSKWGYDPQHAPLDIVEMAQLAQCLGTVRVGQAVVILGLATTETVEQLIKEKPDGCYLLEYLADKIEGLRPEIQRILALQDGMPYYRHLGPAHPALQEPPVMKACAQMEATLTTTPTGAPCLVFAEHTKAQDYNHQGTLAQQNDPIRKTLKTTPILAVGPRVAINSRLSSDYAQTSDLEQTHITPSSATTDVQKRLITLFEEAIHHRASNIALQPDISGMTIARMRVHESMVPMRSTQAIPPEIATEIFNTLHAWSNSTYTETKSRVQGTLQGPADGQFTYRSSDTETFFRVGFTAPDSLGGLPLQCVSLRLQPRNQLHVRLADLRLKPDVIAAIDDAMHEQTGLVLLVGPTSSGKSTTIHGLINLYQNIHRYTKNCLSIENPVERLAPGLVPHSITRDCGFDVMIAALLRQDPDLIFVGELRDRHSASSAVRAANSGHIVPATLHSNNSFSAISALCAYINNHNVDTGTAVMVTEYDLISSINIIIAQQLVPELCPHCSAPTTTAEQEAFGTRLIRYADKHGYIPANTANNKEARANALRAIVEALKTSRKACASTPESKNRCPHCEGRGLAHSLPINEFFAPDMRCKQLLIDMFATKRINFERIAQYRSRTLFQSALERVADGETPLESLYV